MMRVLTIMRLSGGTLLLVSLLSGCQSYWNPEPDFGSSVNGAVRAQAVNPDPPKGNPYAKGHMDGVSAKATVDNYQRSFTSPARSGQGTGSTNSSLVNINSGSATGGTTNITP